MNVPSGYSALDLVGFTDKGDYSASANYVKNDLVHYNDKIWKCLIDDTTGIAPTTGVNWDVWIDQSNSLDRLADVEITNAQDGQELSYDGTTQKWKNTSKIQTLTNQVKDMNNVLGAKNLLPNNAVTQVRNGITFTVNDDGSVRLTGTATASAYIDLPVDLTDGVTYTASGIRGGSSSTYAIHLQTAEGGSTNAGSFVDGEKTFTKNSGQASPNNYDVHIYRIRVSSGATVDTVIYPMIRLASIEDDTYVPYAKNNKELTDDIDTVSSQISDLDIKDISSSFYSSLGANASIESNSVVWKQGKHIFGSIIVSYSGGLTAGSATILLKLAYKPTTSLNTYCIGGTSKWDTSDARLIYMYLNNTAGEMEIADPTGGATIIKINLNYATS